MFFNVFSNLSVSILFTLEDKAYYEINWANENPTSPLETTEPETVETTAITATMTEAVSTTVAE